MKVEGSQYLDEEQAHQLLDDGGIFGDIGTMELQEEAELDKAQGTPRSKAKPRTKASHSGATGDDREEVAAVQTPKELAAATMSKILKEITEAKQYDIKIQGSPSPFAKDVCKSLQGYITRQEELYQQFKGCNFDPPGMSTQLQKKAATRFEWFDKYVRKVACALAEGVVQKTVARRKRRSTGEVLD